MPAPRGSLTEAEHRALVQRAQPSGRDLEQEVEHQAELMQRWRAAEDGRN